MAQTLAIGTDALRRDAPEKLTGRARYAGDLRFPGMLNARLVPSAYAAGRIKSIDTEAAKQVPGVVAVFTAGDLEGTLKGSESGSRRLNFLAKDHVVFAGQPVAVVLAETEAQAEDGVAAVQVEYEPGTAVVDPVRGMEHGAPRVREHLAAGAQEQDLHAAVNASEDEEEHEDLHDNVSNTLRFKRGDVAQGFAEADVIVEDRYTIATMHQGYLEPQTCVITPDPVTGGVTVYTSTQAQFMTRDEVARALGLQSNEVRCVAMTVGGGFGAKYVVIEPFVASLVKKTRRPVRLQYTRSEEFFAANPSPYAYIECKTGAKKDGTLTALQARLVFDTGAYSGSALGIAALLLGGWYRFPNLDIRGYEVVTNKPGVGAYRAPGAPHASFAIESQIDDLAEKLGMDPLELRMKNAIVEGDLWPDGNPWPRIGLVECLEKAQEHPLWQNRHNLPANEGIGIGAGGWPGGRGPAAAACRMDPGGTLTISVGAVDLTGQTTTFALIAAEAFGISADKVRVVISDTESAPHSPGSGGSQITYTVGKAVLEAATEARKQALTIVAQELEANVEDLEIVGDEVQVKGVPDRKVALADVYRMSTNRARPVWGNGASAQEVIAPGFAVHLAHVRVDPDTGEVKVLGYVAIQDVGKALNPPAVIGQIQGGALQGIGFALFEEMQYDDNGQLLTGSFMDYAMPTATQSPAIETVLVEVPAPDGPFGARIVGEPPIIPGAAAIANAMKAATSKRFTHIPIDAQTVYDTLHQ
jgi:CO/xanthine dehydrogenase Mo-binding subunit